MSAADESVAGKYGIAGEAGKYGLASEAAARRRAPSPEWFEEEPATAKRRRDENGVPVKPIIMEWDEWALAFQSEPVTIDYGKPVPDDAPTTQDLISSGVRLHAEAQAETSETETVRSTMGTTPKME